MLDKKESTLPVWKDCGLLEYVETEKKKIKILESFNLAVKILIKEFNADNKFRDEVEICIFFIIRIILGVNKLKESEENIYKDFCFNEDNMTILLNFINDCLESNKNKIHTCDEYIDIKAEFCTRIAHEYVSNQNEIYNLKLKN